MHQPSYKGLTLLELLAVLVILVAVAGTLVPLIPDVTNLAHSATGGEDIKSTAKSLMLYSQLNNGQYPNGLDSLIDENNDVIFDMQNYGYVTTLDDGDNFRVRIREALLAAGIDEIMVHDSTSSNVTFGDYHATADLNGLSVRVFTLREEGIAALSLEPASLTGINAYVALGIGSRNTAIGKTMIDAPLRFHEDGQSPQEAYARWLAIFAVPAEGPLQLATVTGDNEDLNEHLKRYYLAKNP